jgi:hypothetical protein
MTTDDEMVADAKQQADALQAEADRFEAAAKPEPTTDPDATMAMSTTDLLDDDES